MANSYSRNFSLHNIAFEQKILVCQLPHQPRARAAHSSSSHIKLFSSPLFRKLQSNFFSVFISTLLLLFCPPFLYFLRPSATSHSETLSFSVRVFKLDEFLNRVSFFPQNSLFLLFFALLQTSTCFALVDGKLFFHTLS